MKINGAKAKLKAAKLRIIEERRLPNGSGTQLRLKNGAVVNVFDSGTVNVQGLNRAKVEAAVCEPSWAAGRTIFGEVGTKRRRDGS